MSHTHNCFVRTFSGIDRQQDLEDYLNTFEQPQSVTMVENDGALTVVVSNVDLVAAQTLAQATLDAALILAQATLDAQFPAPSADGFAVPDDGSSVVDYHVGQWTIGVAGLILRNFVNVNGGVGDQIVFSGGVIYIHGLDANWYTWDDTLQQYASASSPL